MTDLGKYLHRKSVNKSEVFRKTGISKARLTELSNKESTRLSAKELYLIFLAVGDDPGEEFKKLFKDVKLRSPPPEETTNEL